MQLSLAYWSSLTCVCCSSPGLNVSYVEEAAIGVVLKVDSRVVGGNLQKHCCQVDKEESRSKHIPLFQVTCDGKGGLKSWFDVEYNPSFPCIEVR